MKQLPAPTTAAASTKDAEKWFLSGVKGDKEFHDAWLNAKAKAIICGLRFLKAKSLCQHGDWETLLEDHAVMIKARTVRSYMQLARDVLEWAQAQQPKLKPSQLEEWATKKVMFMSPKGFVNLMRDLREFRPFGEYDKVRYAERKHGGEQIEFHFEKALPLLEVLNHIGEANFSLVIPEGKSEAEVYSDLETKLESALKRVRDHQKNGKPVEV